MRPDFYVVALNVKRGEEGKRVDVVPVRVGNKDLRLKPSRRLHEMVREQTDPRPGIENKVLTTGEFHRDARGIATVTDRRWTGHGQCSAYSPELNPNKIVKKRLDLVKEVFSLYGLNEVGVDTEVDCAISVKFIRLIRDRDQTWPVV